MMLPKADVEELIYEVFEQEALALGGVVSLHGLEDDVVWRLVRALDGIRRNALRRLEAPGSADSDVADGGSYPPHPAIEEFLRKLRVR